MWNWHSLTDCTQNNLSWSAAQLCQTTSRTAIVWNQSRCPSDSLQAAALRGTVWFHMVEGWKVFTVEPPVNSQNDQVYAPCSRYQEATHRSQRSATRALNIQQVGYGVRCRVNNAYDWTDIFWIDPRVKVNGQYYCDVLLSQQMLPAIKRVGERCLCCLWRNLSFFVFCDFTR